MDKVELREARKEDLPELFKFYMMTYQGARLLPIELFEIIQEKENATFFVAECDKKVVGFIIGTINFRKIFLLTLLRMLKHSLFGADKAKKDGKKKIIPHFTYALLYLYEYVRFNTVLLAISTDSKYPSLGRALFHLSFNSFYKRDVRQMLIFTKQYVKFCSLFGFETYKENKYGTFMVKHISRHYP